jgi:hypothetical protein
MKAAWATNFRLILAVWLALSVCAVARGQHGAGGGHGGGHLGGRGGGHLSRLGASAQPRGITRHPPFSAFRFFGRHRRRLAQPFLFSHGLFIGGVGGCDFWDWNCGFLWEDAFGNWMPPALAPGASNPESASASPFVAVLYLKNGYSVGVSKYGVQDDELHYLTTYGGENAIPFDQIDLPRTVKENSSRGIPFTLRPNQPQHSQVR